MTIRAGTQLCANIRLPARWPWWSDRDKGVLVHATSPDRRPTHLASISLLLVPAGAGPILLDDLSDDLGFDEPAPVLEDEHEFHGPHEVALHRRWSLHLAGRELIRDEWLWPDRPIPTVLHCTATPYSYQQCAEIFARVAASVRFDAAATDDRSWSG